MVKFDINEIDKTFATYKKGQIFDGVVVIKRNDGVIFNIGGKNDAFIPANDFDNFDDLKIGDRFKVVITKNKNEEGFIEASKAEADSIIFGNQNAEKLKLGSKFSFVVTDENRGLISKMGEFKIFIPQEEVNIYFEKNLRVYIGRQCEAIVTEYDKENKSIIGSIKLLKTQIKEQAEEMFWKAIFINKIVQGTVEKVLPYGIFVDVYGVSCFCHISNLSHKRIDKIEDFIQVGEIKNFKVIELDREKKKVSLGLKQLEISPREEAIKSLEVGNVYKGKVVKLLPFGAIINLENDASGLLHISNATEKLDKNIYEIVKLDDEVEVIVINVDEDKMKVSFKLKQVIKK